MGRCMKLYFTGSPMFKYIIFFPVLSYFLAYEIISRITYSTPDVLSETFKCELKYKQFTKINAYVLAHIISTSTSWPPLFY